jgi:hypothetical protein
MNTMTNGKRRRMMTLLLVFCLLLIVAIGVQMWSSLYRKHAVGYGEQFIAPIPAEVCPGETISFPVDITIDRGNSVSRVTEGWCRATDGICPRTLQEAPVYYNFITPYSTSTTARRVIPESLTPGAWQIRHCNETHSSSVIDVVCWQVDVMVKDCN